MLPILKLFRLAAVLEMSLIAVEQCFDLPFLPLGGGHLQQIAICFIGAFAIAEIDDATKRR